jgi:hypothetical protein
VDAGNVLEHEALFLDWAAKRHGGLSSPL